MKRSSLIVCFLLFAITYGVYGQKISETNLGLGISKTSLTSQSKQGGETNSPSYLTFTATKSWYNNDHWFAFRKEAGLNLQYSNINFETGGLASSNHYTGTIFSLFADAALLARFRVSNAFAIGIGPEAEILLIGRNNLNNSFYNTLNSPTSGNVQTKGINRDFFNQPNYGIKLSLFETGISEKATLGVSASYLWTKSEYSNFYSPHYVRIGLSIGFKKDKKVLEQPTEESATPLKGATE